MASFFLLVLTVVFAGAVDVQVVAVPSSGDGIMGEPGCMDTGLAALKAHEDIDAAPGGAGGGGAAAALAAYACIPVRRAEPQAHLLVALGAAGSRRTVVATVPAEVCETVARRVGEDVEALVARQASHLRGRPGRPGGGGGVHASARCVAAPETVAAPPAPPPAASPPGVQQRDAAGTGDPVSGEAVLMVYPLGERAPERRCVARRRDLAPAARTGAFHVIGPPNDGGGPSPPGPSRSLPECPAGATVRLQPIGH